MDLQNEQVSTPQKILAEPTLSQNEGKNESELPLPQSSTPSHTHDDEESSNDSLTLQIVLPTSERKDKCNRRERFINREIEEHIEKELAKKPRKTSLTVKKVKSILKYVIGNESVLAMVSSSMKDAGQDLEVEPKLTRSKTRQLREENQIMWPLSPIQQPKPIDNEHLVLIREELPEEEDDDEYRPTIADLQEHSDDESGRQSVGTPSLNISTASQYLANFDPGLLDDTAQDTQIQTDASSSVIAGSFIDFKKPVENIGQRTRSKFSLSSTPLEAIEQAFVPPDITTDMYDFHCDNQEWENFLKDFTQPLLNETADIDEEDDPEYNVIEEEELDREELRRDHAVTVQRSELKTLMMELLGGIEDFSSDEDITKPLSVAPSPNLQVTKEADRIEGLESFVVASPPAAPPSPEPPVIGLTLSQRSLLLQQTRQHVQLLTQHFLQTHRHPLFNNVAANCKKMLVQLTQLAKLNPESAVNVYNLQKAAALTDNWQHLLASSQGSQIIRFYENETNAVQSAKKKKLLYKLKFYPAIVNLIMQSDIFLYPSLLPTQPFRPDFSNRLEFADAEDELIAIGLEQFTPYVKKYPQWYNGRQKHVKLAADLIHELLLPAKTTIQIFRRIRAMRKINDHPIWHYFQHGNCKKVIHQVACLRDLLTVMPPIKLQPELLHSCWKEYAQDLNKEEKKDC